jgi:hypothetical protein
MNMIDAGIDLWWLPLGAGGHFVRANGRVYEAIAAHREHRRPQDLYHTALEVRVPSGRYVVENAWPIPDADRASRGVVVEGPVFFHAAPFRFLRYEVRRWREGVIFDAGWAIDSPQRVSDDLLQAELLLDLVESVPVLTWGRDELGAGEMWNSNSVVSYLLARTGLAMAEIHPPSEGRAPGWRSGVIAAGAKAAAEATQR